jgi:hypothetical protein
MSEINFARGFYFDEPKDTAPEWVVGKVSINKQQFLGWLEKQGTNDKGYVRLDVKRSKDGKIYAALDTWQPQGARSEAREYGGGGSARKDVAEPFDDLADLPF